MRYGYIWRKQGSHAWLRANEAELLVRFGQRVAFIELAGKRQTTVEISCATSRQAFEVVKIFGGKFQRVPKTIQVPPPKPLRVGPRLVINNVGGASVPRRRKAARRESGRRGPSHIVSRRLIIPALAAFGTGEHATTAMCLRMLERVTRRWDKQWKMLDAGTGSGILALAAKCFGAKSVIGIDNDPRAIAIAKDNARSNQIDGIRFMIGDATKLKLNGKLDLIAANLFSDILTTAIPKWQRQLRPGGVLILSGILRSQERGVVRALRRQKMQLKETRRRGKWVAMRARTGGDARLRRVRRGTPRRGIPT